MRQDHALASSVSGTPVTGLRRGAFLGFRWVLLAFLLVGAARVVKRACW